MMPVPSRSEDSEGEGAPYHGIVISVPARFEDTHSDLTILTDRRLRGLYGACVSLVEALTEISMMQDQQRETAVHHVVLGLEARCRDEIRRRKESADYGGQRPIPF